MPAKHRQRIDEPRKPDPFPGWQVRFVWAILIRPYMWVSFVIQMLRLIPRPTYISNRIKTLFNKKKYEKKIQSSLGDYLKMRAEISHGNPDEPNRASDIMEWLFWCRKQQKLL